MSDQEPKEEEEDEFARRFREIEERTRQIVEGARAPTAPEFKPLQRLEDSKTQTPKQPATGKTSGPPKQSMPAHMYRGLGIALAVGYSFVGPILAGIIIGTLLDGRPGGKWTLIGILVGTVAAFVLLIRLVNKLNQNEP